MTWRSGHSVAVACRSRSSASGCGAVGGLMVRGDPADQERAVARALDVGDQLLRHRGAYGNGESEEKSRPHSQGLKPTDAVVGTKVRLPARRFRQHRRNGSGQIAGRSLQRLGLERVGDIFHSSQSHYGEWRRRTRSASGRCSRKSVPAFERLRQRGKTRVLGITAMGDTAALRPGDRCAGLRQRPGGYNMLNPSVAAALRQTIRRRITLAAVRPYSGRRRRRGGHPCVGRRRAVGLG